MMRTARSMAGFPCDLLFGYAALLGLIFGAVHAQAGEVVFDFESGSLDGWEIVEGHFSKPVGSRKFEFHSNDTPYSKHGTYYLTTLETSDSPRPDDRPTGVIESPVFVPEEAKATFMVGGGKHPTTYVALCTLDGKEVRRGHGQNMQKMQLIEWDLGEVVGKPVFLRVVDRHTGSWGHVTMDHFRVAGHVHTAATEERFEAIRHRRRRLLSKAFLDRAESLRQAIQDIRDRYAADPHQWNGALSRLDDLATQANETDGPAFSELEASLATLQREAMTAHPLLRRQPILYVARQQYLPDHHNTATMFQTGEINTSSFRGGGAIKIVDFEKGKAVETLIEQPEGMSRDPCVAFHGNKILFSMRTDINDDYHIHEMKADGSDVRQLTYGSGISDIDPIYLPNGQIVFTSTREPKFCMCNRHIMGNLYTMNADGSNIQQVGHSTLHEGHAALMPDGRVMYDRWEYVDRNFGDAQGVWIMNPDGTNHAIYWGNNTDSPGGVLDPRIVPGGEGLMICTFSSCHDRPWGAIALVDRRLGIDGKRPVVQTWPADAIDLVNVGNYDTFKRVKRKFEDPYPLDDTYYLAAGMTGDGERTGLWLLDRFGNQTLIHEDQPGCFDPMPLAPRTTPPEMPSRVNLADDNGYFYVVNVYEGAGMERVEPGSIKWLRVVESPEKRFWTQSRWNGSGTQAPGMAWDDFNNKRILGRVPVKEDGSVHVAVPADTFVYFQLLDAEGRMVQSMRSGTIARPGERIGCTGCHEDRRDSALAMPPTIAPRSLYAEPQRLEPWYGPPRNFSYMTEMQPVFDRHCVACHDYGHEAGEMLNLAADRGLCFNTSYTELRSKGLVKVIGAGPHRVQPPYSWGSHASRLAEVVLHGHGDPAIDAQIKLDQESIDRIITWIDINAPYYPEYASAYRGHLYGRSPLDPEQIKRLSELTDTQLAKQPFASHVAFERPEKSLCLRELDVNSDAYAAALAIIREGKAQLERRPRADMPDFELVAPVEIRQQAKYQRRLAIENRMRDAIRHGRRLREAASGIPSLSTGSGQDMTQ